MLIEVGWKSSHSPSSVLRGSWRGSLRKDGGFDHGHDQQVADQSQRDVPMHQGDTATIKQVESPQVQHWASRTSSRRRHVAQQQQHSTLQMNHTSLDMVARQRCAKRARPENEQVARGQGPEDSKTGRDEHPERKGGWNSRSEATGAARSEQLGGAQDLEQGFVVGTLASSDRTLRWTCSVRPARARETARTGSTRNADRLINSSMSASRGAH